MRFDTNLHYIGSACETCKSSIRYIKNDRCTLCKRRATPEYINWDKRSSAVLDLLRRRTYSAAELTRTLAFSGYDLPRHLVDRVLQKLEDRGFVQFNGKRWRRVSRHKLTKADANQMRQLHIVHGLPIEVIAEKFEATLPHARQAILSHI